MILVDECFYFSFCFQNIMDFITQFAAANAMNNGKGW